MMLLNKMIKQGRKSLSLGEKHQIWTTVGSLKATTKNFVNLRQRSAGIDDKASRLRWEDLVYLAKKIALDGS